MSQLNFRTVQRSAISTVGRNQQFGKMYRVFQQIREICPHCDLWVNSTSRRKVREVRLRVWSEDPKIAEILESAVSQFRPGTAKVYRRFTNFRWVGGLAPDRQFHYIALKAYYHS